MPDSIFILKNPPLEDSQNYALLRETGINYVEKLAHEIWTDYNAHDPGITILEALCYAITDLGFRTSYDMKDLLTQEVNGMLQNNSNFHTAQHIFTVNPTTFNDLRKWLIDIDGVRNAWISKHNSVQYCLDRLNAKLKDECTSGISTQNLLEPLNGLYDILLEYEDYVEEDDRIAHLGILEEDTSSFLATDFITPGTEGIQFTVYYPVSLYAVSVYPNATNLGNTDNLQIQLSERDETGTFSIISTHLFTLEAGIEEQKTQIRLNLDLEAGKTYLLTANNSTVQLHRRESTSLAVSDFPFHLFGVIDLTNGYDGSPNGNYYFFYDWEINYTVSPVEQEKNQDTKPIFGQVGLVDHTTFSNSLLQPNNQGLAFDVFCPLTLQSVDVYLEGTGIANDNEPITIRILKPGVIQNEVIYEDTFQVDVSTSGAKTLILNWNINPGLGYKLELDTTSSIQLYKNTNVNYPYELSPALVIRHGITNLGAFSINQYYFFYNWQISFQPCLPQVSALTRQDVRRAVIDRIHPVRNLCEDLIALRELETEDIGVCANIGVRIDSDLEEILAEIFYQLELYVSPPVNFYTIEELKERGKTTDEIFEGPLLDHGFIDNDEFRQIERRCYLRSSDIYQIIMDVEGVETVKELFLLSFLEVNASNPIEPGDQVVAFTADGITTQYKFTQEPWILNLQTENTFAPDFRPDRSKIIFFKNGLPYLPNVARAIELYEEKRTANIRNRLKGHAKDLPITIGEDKALETYFPFQNDLPETYRAGQNRVAQSFSELRKAQSKQLKAYLLFFDQILANYLAQLSHIRELFSWESGTYQTYFTQQLGEIAQLEELYIDAAGVGGELQNLITDEEIDEERKNRFLDHLLARFCEDFSQYSLMMYSLYKEEADPIVIGDKQCFLKDYPLVSSQRGKAFDYRNVKEITGYHRRMYRLLGIRENDDCKIGWRRFSSDRFRIELIPAVSADEADTFQIQLLDESGTEVLFESNPDENCTTQNQACALLDNLIPFIAKSNINIEEDAIEEEDWKFNEVENRWELLQGCQDAENNSSVAVLGYANTAIFSDSLLETKRALKHQIIDYFAAYAYREGFHLIEHILLRKRTLEDPFMPVELNTEDDCDCVEVTDPYSFRATIILPSWPERFQRTRFRQYMENLLRLEAPAHIYLKICWISHCEMQEFEACYCDWLEQHAALPDSMTGELPLTSTVDLEEPLQSQMTNYSETLKQLIEKMHSLTTVFPMARLHDCQDDGGGEPPITLNNVSLGSL